MRRLTLPTRLLSEAIWTRLFEAAAPRHLDRGTATFSALGRLDTLRSKAQYNTGSISTSAQWALFSLSHFWRPQVVAEVGTFIGKSAFAIALGAEEAGQELEIHTCDASNRFDLPTDSVRSQIVQYPGSTSTQMLGEMVEDGFGQRVNLFHFDGRLQKDDLPLVATLAAPDAIIVLDDFEGMEKGVANLFNLRQGQAFRNHLCIYPPSETLLRRLGFWDHATCALLLPSGVIEFTAQ